MEIEQTQPIEQPEETARDVRIRFAAEKFTSAQRVLDAAIKSLNAALKSDPTEKPRRCTKCGEYEYPVWCCDC